MRIKNLKEKLNLEDSTKLAEIDTLSDALLSGSFPITESEAEALLEKKKKRIKFRTIPQLIKTLEKFYNSDIERVPTLSDLTLFNKFIEDRKILGSEYWFCPEDNFYDTILRSVKPNDIIFDIGAGDLRLDLLLSRKVQKIYAVEINPEVIANALKVIGLSLPKNLIVIVGNAFEIPLPSDITLIIALMIHRCHDFTPEMKEKRILYAQQGSICEFRK